LLDHVDQIKRLDTSGVPPTTDPLALSNVLRPDEVRPGLTPAEALAAAPAVEDGRFSVPSILGEMP
ncbi:MAG: Asp-tRNA(Asn)/Glu-tRNA(Gln) amidotransferase subunit GatC, partial [Acidimicrobiales bacterium]